MEIIIRIEKILAAQSDADKILQEISQDFIKVITIFRLIRINLGHF